MGLYNLYLHTQQAVEQAAAARHNYSNQADKYSENLHRAKSFFKNYSAHYGWKQNHRTVAYGEEYHAQNFFGEHNV